jgi:hypothetical protein
MRLAEAVEEDKVDAMVVVHLSDCMHLQWIVIMDIGLWTLCNALYA